MIKFIVLIEENQKGVLLRYQTPAGVATPGEIKVGLNLKKALSHFADSQGCLIGVDWKSPNNEIETNS